MDSCLVSFIVNSVFILGVDGSLPHFQFHVIIKQTCQLTCATHRYGFNRFSKNSHCLDVSWDMYQSTSPSRAEKLPSVMVHRGGKGKHEGWRTYTNSCSYLILNWLLFFTR